MLDFNDDASDFDLADAMAFGTGYALYRHGQDRQTQQITDAIRAATRPYPDDDHLLIPPAPPEPLSTGPEVAVNHQEFAIEMPEEWEDYIGQEPLKRQLSITLASAALRRARAPHILLASGYPGVGKTMMARLIAKTMGVNIVEVVPPFKVETLVRAAEELGDRDILFIDEIHKLTDGVGARGAEMLLKVLEDGVAYLPDGSVVKLKDITVIGATTDRDQLPEPVVDRFKVKPYFQAYDLNELARIAVKFGFKHHVEYWTTNEIANAIAHACRATPRIIEEMIMAVRDLGIAYNRQPTPEEMLKFLEVEWDGLTRTHVHYLTAMRQYFARETKDGTIEYIVGEAAMQQILRETKQGIGRVERFLIERGLLDRTPRGRRLTPAGIARAEHFIAEGKGVSAVA